MEKPICCQDSRKLSSNLWTVTDFLKIINEPNRLKILCLLRQGEQCVCNIWQMLEMPQNLTSHHLKVLKDFGLIESRQEGRNIIYSSNQKMMLKYVSFLNDFLISNVAKA